MYIDKILWEKLKENIDNLYWDEDRMSSDGRYFLKQIDNNVKEIESKNIKMGKVVLDILISIVNKQKLEELISKLKGIENVLEVYRGEN